MPVPAIPSSLLEPVWVEFAALLPERGEFHPDHPLGCHRRRIPDRVVFEHLVDALIHGSGYERIANRRMFGLHHPPSAQGLGGCRHRQAGPRSGAGRLRLDHRPAVGRHHGGWVHQQGPLRRRQIRTVSTGANRHDSPLLAATLQAATDQVGAHWPDEVTVHLDAGYDSNVTRTLLDGLGLHGEIARKGVPAPVQVGKRWVAERTHGWMNGYGKLRRCTDRDGKIVDFFPYLAATFVTVRALLRAARTRYRWSTRPTTLRLK